MVNIFQDRCQRRRYAKSECALCAEVCPIAGCISFDGPSVVVDNGSCVNCGICTTACPTGSLELSGLSEKELLERLLSGSNKESLSLTCGLGPEGGSLELLYNSSQPGSVLVKIPCLAMLKESHLIALTTSGVKAITLEAGRCPQCSFSAGKEIIEKTVSYACNIIEGACISGSISINGEIPKPVGRGVFNRAKRKEVIEISVGHEYSRRELFTFFKEKAKESAKERILGYTEVQKEVSSLEAVPPRRSILIDALTKAAPRTPAALKEGGFPAHSIEINENCIACKRCEAFCPTGAITTAEAEGELRIEFRQGLCMGCFQCKEFCPAGALGYREEISLEEVFRGGSRAILKKAFMECVECGEAFFPDINKEGCPTCAKRNKMDKKILSLLFRH